MQRALLFALIPSAAVASGAAASFRTPGPATRRLREEKAEKRDAR